MQYGKKSGAVPAAVISNKLMLYATDPSVDGMGRRINDGVSQKTCHFQVMLSGIRATVEKPDVLFPHVSNK